MSPCSPNDVSVDIPSGPSGPAIPGFGVPFSIKLPVISPIPEGFPEDLLDILDKLSMIIPPGSLKPALNPNFGKDIFDGIMKLLDQFMPYLMMYKFFLPILKIILCIIEVLCALKNPFKLIRAIKKLFRKCIPEFLNLFPIFALIIMIISMLLLLLALIEYIISELLKLIELILRNIRALYNIATLNANENSILAIAKKIGAILCSFQNLFVLLSIFNIIFDIFRDMLSLFFSIPPCDNTDPTDLDGCCTPDVCPQIVKTSYSRTDGELQYYNQVSQSISGSNFRYTLRPESWQIFDFNQQIQEKFINIVDAYDIPEYDLEGNRINNPKPVFFPTDAVYTASSAPKQVAYTIDLKVYYNPANWGRYGDAAGLPRYIQFKDCIVLNVPSRYLTNYTGNNDLQVDNGVLKIAGGLGYEDDGTTILKEYLPDGITLGTNQATLNTFLHTAEVISLNPQLQSTDGYLFNNAEYIFKPNFQVLNDKGLITAGCEEGLAFDKAFVNNVFAGDINTKLPATRNALKTENGFPDPNKTQESLLTAISGLRNNLTTEGVANFQATSLASLQKLKDDTNNAIATMIGLGFDPCKSDFTLDAVNQFTSKPIKVSVNIKERNGFPITTNLSSEIAENISDRIKSYATFGEVSNFTYDGTQAFIANITSKLSGKGKIMISFDDNIFCTNYLPDDVDETPTHSLQELEYQFVYTPGGISAPSGDESGVPRRDESDKARDNSR